MNTYKKNEIVQKHSPDGGFLQSEEWRKFQESTGKKTFHIEGKNIWENAIEHSLPIVGKYFYLPRGPINNSISKELFALAEKENAGWIRVDNQIGDYKKIKAPHDMQPKEVLIIDIDKSEEQLLSEMKSKTRYNINLAKKKEVKIFSSKEEKYIEKFCDLVEETADRDNISSHPRDYYKKMLKNIPSENIELYLAEYRGKIISANIIFLFGKFATYAHGASSNDYRNVMAPYLLQWQAILDAKKRGCEKYDFGGVNTKSKDSWSGITRFKTGFSPNTKTTEFSGSYDVIIKPFKYNLYRFIQKIKKLV